MDAATAFDNNEGCLPIGKIIILTGGCSYIIFSYSSMISLCNIASFPLVINNNSTFKVFKGTSTVNPNQFVLTVPQYLDSPKSPNYHFDTIDKIVLLQDWFIAMTHSSINALANPRRRVRPSKLSATTQVIKSERLNAALTAPQTPPLVSIKVTSLIFKDSNKAIT